MPMNASVTVVPLDQPEQMRAAIDLYRSVFELDQTDPAVSPRLLASLRLNGGSVMGAYDGPRLVGFAYGFIGKDPSSGEIYHYSQTAAVDSAYQGRGVGRALKYGQREFILSTGITKMRWSYDPVRAGNAHFNLDVLGARGRWFVPNLYGLDDMGRDAGHRSDRLIVEWDLAGSPSPAPVSRTPAVVPAWGEVVRDHVDLLLGVPRHWSAVAGDHAEAERIRTVVSAALAEGLDDGYVATSCVVADDDTAYYRLRPAGA